MSTPAPTIDTSPSTTDDSALYHRCPLHPFEGDGECSNACPTLCGFVGDICGPERCDDEVRPDNCVVCDALFAARYGSPT